MRARSRSTSSREPTGKQDQYVAAHGGICAYTFNRDGSVDVEPLSLSRETLERLRNNLLLFYTGEARSASTILADQVARTESGDEEMQANLDRTKAIGFDVRTLLETRATSSSSPSSCTCTGRTSCADRREWRRSESSTSTHWRGGAA